MGFCMEFIIKKMLLAFFLTPLISYGSCLNVGVIDNNPAGYLDESGKKTGVHWDYFEVISEYTQLCMKKELLPYARVRSSLNKGSNDISLGLMSPSKLDALIPIALIREIKTVVIARMKHSVNSYHDIKNLTIGKTRGTRLSKHFDQDKSLKIEELDNYAMAVRMLISGRIDAIAGSLSVLTYQLQQYDSAGVIQVSNHLELGKKEQWLFMSKKSKHTDKIPLLSEAVSSLKSSGKIQKILDKHYLK